ncbi:MAG: helix-turn-helix domain-containing protein [Roseibium sp.]|uniref:helix-turn-helix domain-containing protein n=1 Tax=Roseibium sp. TaxID=1936156 RepID=UPI0026114B09|nr:helix-turn-helix domain-containing protein [Roseibium sp.]MCV0427360.1 helix-turn-helix domain-containing protein [Roseibium sp.]
MSQFLDFEINRDTEETSGSFDTDAHFVDFYIPEISYLGDVGLLSSVLEAANSLSSRSIYRWRLRDISTPRKNTDQSSVHTSIFLGNARGPWLLCEDERRHLCRIFRFSKHIVLIGGAVFLPGAKAIEENKPLAVHSNFFDAAAEENIEGACIEHHTISHGRLRSATTALAAVRLILAMVEEDEGSYLAGLVADQIGLPTNRQSRTSRRAAQMIRQSKGDPIIEAAIRVMSNHVENPLSIGQIADKLFVSERVLQRLIKALLNTTPLKVYRLIRLEVAHNLLRHTNLSVMEASTAVGFESRRHFTYWYRTVYGNEPHQTRLAAFQGSREVAQSSKQG